MKYGKMMKNGLENKRFAEKNPVQKKQDEHHTQKSIGNKNFPAFQVVGKKNRPHQIQQTG